MTGPGARDRLASGLGALTLAAVVSTVGGSRISTTVGDIGFVVLVVLIVVFVVMAWWRFGRSRKDGGTTRWRVWVGLGGCVALSLALATPLIPFFFFFVLRWGFGPRWDFKMLMLGFSLAAVLLGFLGARGVRFPLIAGGLVLGSLALLLPVGV